jgi:hypothetical protein
LLRHGFPAQDPRRPCVDDRRYAALNAAVGFRKMSLQMSSLHDIVPGQRWKARQFLFDRSVSDKSPFRRAMHDNRNTHRAETEAGLRLMERPSGCGRRWGQDPVPRKVLAPVLQLSQCLAAVLSASLSSSNAGPDHKLRRSQPKSPPGRLDRTGLRDFPAQGRTGVVVLL